MPASILALRYAKALYQAASDAGELKEAEACARALVLALQDEAVAAFAARRGTPANQKLVVFEKAFGKKLAPTIYRCLRVVFENKRGDELRGIFEAFLDHLAGDRRELKASITTATPLSAAQRKTLENSLSRKLKRKVELIPVTDESLIAGAVLRIDDKVYDSSMKRQVKRLRESLMAEPKPPRKKTKSKPTGAGLVSAPKKKSKAKVKTKAKKKAAPKKKKPASKKKAKKKR